MINSQKQQAGDNSQQIIVQNLHVGIDEERARRIYDEKYEIAKAQFTKEAILIADSRIREFENKLLIKMKENEGAMQSLADPSMQMLLIEAQKSAAQTDRGNDYDILSELLVQRHKNRASREKISGLNRAVGIVHEISSEALLALTVIYVVRSLTPLAGDPIMGISALNDIFLKIVEPGLDLPVGFEWVDHVDLIRAARIIPFQSGLNPLLEIFKASMSGYVCVGIELSSNEYQRALSILDSRKLPHSILVENKFNPGYVRLDLPSKGAIDGLSLTHNLGGRSWKQPLSETQRGAILEIFDLYGNDSNAIETIANKFMNEWNNYPVLKKISDWWGSVNHSMDFTKAGMVLAHANAQRCDISIPSLN